MHAIKISASGGIKPLFVENNGEPLYKLVRKEIDGYMENVYPGRLPKNTVMIVDEEGKLKGKPVNLLASVLYESEIYGDYIVGDVVILKLGEFEGGQDVVGFSDTEAEELLKSLIYIRDGER